MAATQSDTVRVVCPNCRARYDVPSTMVGRKGPCAKCGHVLTVTKTPGDADPLAPGQPSAESLSRNRVSEETSDEPRWSSVDCRVCGTRLTGPASQVGKGVKCPDCGAQTVLPPPPPPKKKVIPAAMEGDQYELWDVDQAPLPSELKRREPKYIAISCRLCQTLMHAKESDAGRTIACPDCGTEHVVPAPEPAKAGSRGADDDLVLLAPEPLPAAPPPPPVAIPPRRKMLYEEEAEAERRKREEAQREGKLRGVQYDQRGRPIMPRQPLVTGIYSFLFSPGALVRWVMLGIVLAMVGAIGLQGVGMAMSGGFGAIAGMCFYAGGLIGGILWSAAAASMFLAIVVESSEGNDRVYNWPSPSPFEWFAELGYMLIAVLMSAFPGWAVAWVSTGPPWLAPMLFFSSIAIFLPIVILSQLEISSAFGVVSGKVLASLAQCPVSWLLLYVQIAFLGLVGGGIIVAAGEFSPLLLLALPLYVAGGIFVFARLIGRLGWKLAEATSSAGEEE